MPDDGAQILVAFSDRTLGGVSRSALSAGRIWRMLGKRVAFLAFLPVHAARQERFESIGPVLRGLEDVDWTALELVHLHHGSMAPQIKRTTSRLIHAAQQQRRRVPLMTKNVFAVDDRFLRAWPGPRATTVPGKWTAMQYAYNRGKTLRGSNAWLIPNVQDDEFFRLPSPDERQRARDQVGLKSGDFCVLRIGSPLMGKWSNAYVDLADAVAKAENAKLVIVGAPKPLLLKLANNPAVVSRSTTSSDEELRDLYWASDSFALDSQRGETFGNVAFEALLCGLPVAYRSRPFRDNTPWELLGQEGFAFAESSADWVEAAMRPTPVSQGARQNIVEAYGYGAVPQYYMDVYDGLQAAEGALGQVWSPSSEWHAAPGVANKLKVMFVHNPLGMRAKELRLALRARRA